MKKDDDLWSFDKYWEDRALPYPFNRAQAKEAAHFDALYRAAITNLIAAAFEFEDAYIRSLETKNDYEIECAESALNEFTVRYALAKHQGRQAVIKFSRKYAARSTNVR